MAEISVVGEKTLHLNSGRQVEAPKILSRWCDLELFEVNLAEVRLPCYFFVSRLNTFRLISISNSRSSCCLEFWLTQLDRNFLGVFWQCHDLSTV